MLLSLLPYLVIAFTCSIGNALHLVYRRDKLSA